MYPPARSPNLNPAESLIAWIKQRLKEMLDDYTGKTNVFAETTEGRKAASKWLRTALTRIQKELKAKKHKYRFFKNWIHSMKSRVEDCLEKDGGNNTKY